MTGALPQAPMCVIRWSGKESISLLFRVGPSDAAQPGLRRIDPGLIDRPDPRYGDDRGFGGIGTSAVVVRRAGDPHHEGTGRGRRSALRVEVGPAVAPPDARDHHTQPVGAVEVGRTHEAGYHFMRT